MPLHATALPLPSPGPLCSLESLFACGHSLDGALTENTKLSPPMVALRLHSSRRLCSQGSSSGKPPFLAPTRAPGIFLSFSFPSLPPFPSLLLGMEGCLGAAFKVSRNQHQSHGVIGPPSSGFASLTQTGSAPIHSEREGATLEHSAIYRIRSMACDPGSSLCSCHHWAVTLKTTAPTGS